MDALRKTKSRKDIQGPVRRLIALKAISQPSSRKEGATALPLNSVQVGETAEFLQERLDEMPVFELMKDGVIAHHSFTIRGLYKYVMECITGRPADGSRHDLHPRDVNDGNVPSTVSHQDSPHSAAEGLPPVPPRSSLQPTGRPSETMHSHGRKTSKVTYHERLGGYLHPRDMRRLITPVSASNEPELIVRRHVMLFNFTPVRVIVLRERMLVILPDDETEASWLVDHLVTTFHGKHAEGVGSSTVGRTKQDGNGPPVTGDEKLRQSKNVFGKLRLHASRFSRGDSSMGDETTDDIDSESFFSDGDSHHASEWIEMNRRDWIHLPFELQATDSILFCMNELLARDTAELVDMSHQYIDQILEQKNIGDDHFKIVRIIKDGRREMSSRVKGFCASMTRTLNEDEDMALMNLSRLLTHPENFVQPVSPQTLENESDEPELILESHLQHGYSLMNTLDLIQGKIESASDLWEQQLDATRNKILLANMLLTTVALCLTAASVVGSFLGMNIGVPGEGVDGYFMPVVTGTMGGVVVLGLLILGALVMTGTIQRTSAFGASADDE
ncbi:hypothetical protein MPSEU_000333800 [Mayamaea pseudoterrestris]|nr:hypothetical protein MPSEU_000333800 [Mayamaea pseudoterrestris]